MKTFLSDRSGARSRSPAQAGAWSSFERLEHEQFAYMQEALRPHGGMILSEAAVEIAREFCEQPISRLARWIVDGAIVTLLWHGRTWVPMFQLQTHKHDLALRIGCVRAVAELREAFDDWEIVVWFATPNGWLNDQAPVAMLNHDESRVVEAARADRFIARG
jgi:hypothetical protein